jgi:hypothetical protein
MSNFGKITFFDFMNKLIINDFHIVILDGRIYFIYINVKHLVIFNKKLCVINVINIDKLKKIIIRDEYSILLKFYKGNNIDHLTFQFLSVQDNLKFINDILPDSLKDLARIYKRMVILHMIRDKRLACSPIIEKLKIPLISRSSYYTSGLSSILNKRLTINKLVFMLNSCYVVEMIYNCLAYNMNYISDKVDSEDIVAHIRRTLHHRDSMKIIHERRRIEYRKSLQFRKSQCEAGDISDDCHRFRHKKIQYIPYSKTIYHQPTYKSNESRRNFNKLKFNRVIFNVMLVKYFGKDEKALEIKSNNIVSIYNKKIKVQ